MTATSTGAGGARVISGGAVAVRVPATSANLGPGFDSLGLALGRYDEITVRTTEAPGVTVDIRGEGRDELPRDETHLVVRSMRATFDRLGVRCPGLALAASNTIPQGRGLGSSAAAIVAGVLAATALCTERPPDRPWALDLASGIEGHPDNVAACLLGGLTIAWQDHEGAHAARVDPSPGVAAVVFVPDTRLSTSTARGLLPESVPHQDAAHAAGRAALLVQALARRPDLLFPATEDRLHQQYRAAAMPASAALVERLRSARVAAVVSGAGPTILGLLPGNVEGAVAHVPHLADIAGPGWSVEVTAVDVAGAQVRRL